MYPKCTGKDLINSIAIYVTKYIYRYVKICTDRQSAEKGDVINKWIKNREELRKQLVTEKIGKQEFQRDIAVPLAKPVTKSLEYTKQAIDKKQDKMIEQLQENQRAITNAIEAMPQQMQALEAFQELPAHRQVRQ